MKLYSCNSPETWGAVHVANWGIGGSKDAKQVDIARGESSGSFPRTPSSSTTLSSVSILPSFPLFFPTFFYFSRPFLKLFLFCHMHERMHSTSRYDDHDWSGRTLSCTESLPHRGSWRSVLENPCQLWTC